MKDGNNATRGFFCNTFADVLSTKDVNCDYNISSAGSGFVSIDGINKGEDPFGYGIRADGKILIGARADVWLEKDFQKGKKDN